MRTNEEVKAYIDSLKVSKEEKERIMETVLYHAPKIEKYLKENKA